MGLKGLLDKNNTNQIFRWNLVLVQCLFLKYGALKFGLIYVESCFQIIREFLKKKTEKKNNLYLRVKNTPGNNDLAVYCKIMN